MNPATVTTLLSIENANSKRFFLEVIERLRNFEGGGIRILRQNRRFDFFPEGIDCFAARDFAGSVERRLDAVSGHLVGNFEKIIPDILKRDLTLRFAGHGNQFSLHFNDFADERLGEFNRLDKLLFGQLIRRALNHHERLPKFRHTPGRGC